MAEMILGMDIGGTNLRMGLVDRALAAFHVEVTSSRDLFSCHNPLQALAEQVLLYLDRHLGGEKPAMVCAGLPAVLDRSRRRVWSATNFPGLENRDVVAELEALLGLPVVIEHDAYYLLAYDIMHEGLVNEGTMMGCYFGTGLGNAVFIDGKPYIGKNGTACELGHMAVPLQQRLCSCGNRGCIEMFSCGKALEQLARERFPEEPLGELFLRHGRSPYLQDFLSYMAAAVATEINSLDPDGVFLGGGLIQMEGFPREELARKILANTRKPYPAQNLSLYFSTPSPENGIIGAAVEGWRRLEGR
ncbi:MAG: allose kinase [Candidatus Limiplasma sp.]|nr:allose kinase [Candidatus Limiplasma sp.]